MALCKIFHPVKQPLKRSPMLRELSGEASPSPRIEDKRAEDHSSPKIRARVHQESGPNSVSLKPLSLPEEPRKAAEPHSSPTVKPPGPEAASGKPVRAIEKEMRLGHSEKSISRILGRHSETIYATLRCVAGLLFMFHGVQKIFGAFGGNNTLPAGSLIWIAGYIELIGGSLIMIGLLTSWAAFLASGTMAVAYFMAHQPQGALPIQNQGELAALYSFVFLCIAARGSDFFSVAQILPGLGPSRAIRILDRHAGTIYGLLRIAAGFMFMCHGLQKMFGVLGGEVVQSGTLPWFAGVIELVCGGLIMIGLLASWAAFLASGTMAVAYFMAHQLQGFLPIQNHGELAALYAFVFLYIAARGSGALSVARALRNPGLD